MTHVEPAIHADPEILAGKPVSVGTRVPFQALVDHFEGGHTLDEFLDDFPSVSRELAIRALDQAKDLRRFGTPRNEAGALD